MSNRTFKWIAGGICAAIVVLFVRGFAFTPCSIPSAGMEDSLFQGECVLVNRWSYGLRIPFMTLFPYHRWKASPVGKRDVVVFNNPAAVRTPVIDRREIYVGRCVGIPGDTLSVDSAFSAAPSGIRAGSGTKPLVVPGKGRFVRVCPWNITLLRNTLVMHEGRQAEIKNDTLFVDGRPVRHCYFTKDYYWMQTDHAGNAADSRLFGFVPYDHMIGKAAVVCFSKEKGTGLFKGYRWNRFFRRVE